MSFFAPEGVHLTGIFGFIEELLYYLIPTTVYADTVRDCSRTVGKCLHDGHHDREEK